jgi:hypothetical protein
VTQREVCVVGKKKLRARLAFVRKALAVKRKAYIALLEGHVKSYTIDGYALTYLDLDKLAKQIDDDEQKIDAIEAALGGKAQRKAFGVVPMDW